MHIKNKEYQFVTSDIENDVIYGQVKIEGAWFDCKHDFNGDIKAIENYAVYADQDNKFKLEI